MRVEINNYIVADTEICHGKPTFNGTRVMVWQVLEMLEGGMSVNEIIEAFPSLNKDYIKAALRYASNLMKGRENVQFSVPLEN
ncbi:antitoxin [Candidatus Pacearchaeota archaeon]|nr:antitoxin [Candidatus Pacearchaeota archaeon]